MRSITVTSLLVCVGSSCALADLSTTDPFAKVIPGSSSRAIDVVISEILGSTSGTDWEFIELCNTGHMSVDITGWMIELWDSDVGGSYGGADGGSPFAVSGSVTLAPGQTYTLGNALAAAGYPNPPYFFDGSLPSNAVENSSYTAVLANASGTLIDAVFVTDGGAGDSANRAGTAITPSMTVGPDGSNLPAGFARTDVIGGHVLLNFDTTDLADGTLEGGTPGICQIPAPGAGALLALGSLMTLRRRRT